MNGGMKRNCLLLAALGGMVALYFALTPWLRSINAETARIEKETKEREEKAKQVASVSQQNDALLQEAQAKPTNFAAQMGAAVRLQELGNLNAALTCVQNALRVQPNDSKALLLRADLYQRMRRYYDSITDFKDLIQQDPNNERAYVQLGWLYVTLGWVTEGRELLEPASVRLTNPQLKIVLALLCMQQNDFAKAERILLGVKQTHPMDAGLWGPLADLYLKMRRFPDAVKVAQEANVQQPNDIKILTALGQGYYGVDDIPNAIKIFERILELEPNHVFALHRMALCYRRQKRTDEELKAWEKVLSIDPGFEQTRLLAGQLYLSLGRKAEGEKLLAEYREALKRGQKRERTAFQIAMQGQSAKAHWEMAQVYQSDGDLPRVLVELKKTLEIDPNHAGAKQALAELERQPAGNGG